MSTIRELISAGIALTTIGLALRLVVCVIEMLKSEEQRAVMKKRAINALVWTIISANVWVLKSIVDYYYGR